MDLTTIETESLEAWLSRHVAAIEAGVNVGQIDRDKAQAFRVELIKRGSSLPNGLAAKPLSTYPGEDYDIRKSYGYVPKGSPVVSLVKCEISQACAYVFNEMRAREERAEVRPSVQLNPWRRTSAHRPLVVTK